MTLQAHQLPGNQDPAGTPVADDEFLRPGPALQPVAAGPLPARVALPAARAANDPQRRRRGLWVAAVAAMAVLALLAAAEGRTSYLQSRVLARLAGDLSFATAPGPGRGVRAAVVGPYDRRLGYDALPAWIEALTGKGYVVQAQARLSPQLDRLIDLGVFPLYPEKHQAGLEVLDRRGVPIFSSRYPRAVYEDFAAIPPVVVSTLSFIEDRDVLDPDLPRRNPAIAWERLGQALLLKASQLVNPGLNVPGGSTLATQIEKFRHSEHGLTLNMGEKLRQLASASLRSYMNGPLTLDARREIVRAYLNGVPLAARAGYGEVHGLQDGLRVWFGADPAEVNRLLAAAGQAAPRSLQARAYREVLSLLLAQQRPSWFLGPLGFEVLASRVDEYTRLLAGAGVIDETFRDAVLAQRLPAPVGVVGEARDLRVAKTAYTIRSRLVSLLGLKGFYELDRLDLKASTTLDLPVQQAVAARLLELKQPEQVRQSRLMGQRLLEPDDPLDRVIYSFSLFEATPAANVLRVQADNYVEPFDINEGVRLDLGSTAKLRTLVHYLEIIASLHGEYAGKSAAELRAATTAPDDTLRRWVIDYLRDDRDPGLRALLGAAMDRSYSASPAETFITGGGAHRFANFKREDNGRVVSLRQALRESINLPFVRLMRDIVRYHVNRSANSRIVLADRDEPRRADYLRRFADREGTVFLRKYYRKYEGRTPEQRFELLLDGVRAAPVPLAVAFRSVYPGATEPELAEFLLASLRSAGGEDAAGRLYRNYAQERYSLMDRGYLAKVHPLELWLVAYLQQHPQAALDEVIQASAQERIDVYGWLLKSRNKRRQDLRIRSLLEIEAFNEIHAAWARVGYPFSYLTPSYATAIGSSADRPAALAELMGIIVRGGIRAPTTRLDELHFAAGTPYEASLRFEGGAGQRVLPEEVTDVVRAALFDVVAHGTAVRLAAGIPGADGVPLPVGGKTGTGDHRAQVFDHAGRLVRERVVNRAATFAFFIGDRFYGTVSAYVPGEEAASFTFTSALVVELLRQLGPSLQPLLTAAPAAPRG